MRFDDNWPLDPRLDPYRDAVWELSRNNKVVGYLSTRGIPQRTLWAKREVLWYQITWLDRRRERHRPTPDPPGASLDDLEHGRYELLDIGNRVLDARPVERPEHDRLWQGTARRTSPRPAGPDGVSDGVESPPGERPRWVQERCLRRCPDRFRTAHAGGRVPGPRARPSSRTRSRSSWLSGWQSRARRRRLTRRPAPPSVRPRG